MSGPQFLLLFVALTLAANIVLRRYLRRRESARPTRFLEFAQEPYRIACLAAGQIEALRVCVFSLVDRGLLEEDDGRVRRARDDAESLARRPLEKAVLAACADWERVPVLAKNGVVADAIAVYKAELQRDGLLADAQVLSERFLPSLAAAALLGGIALIRADYAVRHGHRNLGLLVVLVVIAFVLVWLAWRRSRTGLGDTALERLRTLFAALKRNAARLLPGGESNDAVLTAAIFGMAALPQDRFPYVARLFPRHRDESGNEVGSSGGGCGGGGCSGGGCGGGGCGGCGG